MRTCLVFAAVLLAACAQLSDRVILLPAADGGNTGALSVRAARGEVLLAQAYAQADVVDAEPRRLSSSAQAVRAYRELLAMQPQRPRRFVVGFEHGDALRGEAAALLEQLRIALQDSPGADLVIVGHTDRVGGMEANDQLSLRRARIVRDRLVAAGAAPQRISVAGRGEREPVVPTDDEVAEPRNRRVEIRLR